jgi:ribonuclease P protein component
MSTECGDYGFPPSHRLRRSEQFDAVFAAGERVQAGPLRIIRLRNDCGHHRLGLVVSRRVGTAVRRNRVKRMIREAFRQTHHQWAENMDLVVIALAHRPAGLAKYQQWLTRAASAESSRKSGRK